MRLWFCHITGGVHNFDFHRYLTESIIREYRNQGCKVEGMYCLENGDYWL